MRKKSRFKTIVTSAIILAVILILSTVVYLTPKKTPIQSAFVNAAKEGVCLTFNVYQGTIEVEETLYVLSTYGVTATFFLGGCWVAKNPQTVRKIIDSGNVIGTHGYYHYDHASLSYEQNVKEIKKSVDVLIENGVSDVKLFAPPSGSYCENCVKAVDDLGLTMVLWSVDTIDWRDQDEELIKNRVLSKVKKGDIILMHPTPATVRALPDIIEGILAKDLKILPLDG